MATTPQTPTALRQRLLRDIDEMTREPYPGITLYLHGDELEKACLVLDTEGFGSLHLTVEFGESYPLEAPKFTMQSLVAHPNVFGDYICATILNTEEDYTPAYTFKTIAIQLLSFFSGSIEQDYSNEKYKRKVDLAVYGDETRKWAKEGPAFACAHCGCGGPAAATGRPGENGAPVAGCEARSSASQEGTEGVTACVVSDMTNCPVDLLPTELILRVMELLNAIDLLRFKEAWERAELIACNFDIVRMREMICFVTKKSWRYGKMGIGVRVQGQHKGTKIHSEFEYLSLDAFQNLKIRNSISGIPFQTWLPLPISQGHWRQVTATASEPHTVKMALEAIRGRAGPQCDDADTVVSFMNDVVVQLNDDLTASDDAANRTSVERRTSLRHASEKAIDAYFQLFHMLVCMAVDDPRIVHKANDMIKKFLSGKTSKTDVPNLGHLLIVQLISDIPSPKVPDLMKLIVGEAITRNVVWLLTKHPELAYIEPDDQRSDYRLSTSFAGSLTSYRLLMFSELFRQVVHAMPTTTTTTTDSSQEDDARSRLEKMRDKLFLHHGSPPPGTAETVAAELRRLQTFRSFQPFIGYMKLAMPNAVQFSAFLRRTVADSMAKGYSQPGISQGEAHILRRAAEPNNTDLPTAPTVPMLSSLQQKFAKGRVQFFPARNGRGGDGGKGKGKGKGKGRK